MKVLMTGMSARSVGSTKVRYDYTTLPGIYAAALRELGHEVDMRAVEPGEDLDEYEHVFCLVNWISSLSTPHSAKVGDMLSRRRQGLTLYVDDWRSSTVGDDIHGHMTVGRGWEHHRGFRQREYAKWDARGQERIREALSELTLPSNPFPVLLASYDWGKSDFFIGKHPLTSTVIRVEPTSLMKQPWEDFARPRRRAWSLATFQDPSRWVGRLKLEWPVVQHGGDKKLPGGGSIDKYKLHPVVSERELMLDYATLRGMLTPPYATDGSGWWRARYVHASRQGCIIHMPARDGELVGPSFQNEAADIEQASDAELDALAERQKALLMAWEWSEAMAMDRLQMVVEGMWSL